MALEDKKQELNREGRPQKSAERETTPPKEVKKDASILGEKPDMKTSDFLFRVKQDQSFYSKTNLGADRREELGRKLFGSYGGRIDRGEIDNAKTELGKGKWGKFKDFSYQDKIDAEKLIKGLEHLGE